MKFNKAIIIRLLLSFLGMIGIVLNYQIGTNVYLTLNLLNVFIFIMLYYFYQKVTIDNKKEKIFSIIFSIFLSLILVIGNQLDKTSNIKWNIITLIEIFCLIFAIFPFIIYSFNIIKKIKKHYDFEITKKRKIIIFSTIFVFNFLVFLAIYPGVYGYDAGFQIMEVLNKNIQLTSHFSVIYSYFLAKCIQIGQVLFNSNEIGFAIYSLLQMTFMTYVATRISLFSYKLSKNKYILLLSIIFFSLFPLYMIMTISACQDTIFGGIFALLIINFIEHYDNIKSKKIFIKIVILSFMLCAIRNNGYYALLVVVVMSLLFNKNKRLLSTIPLIISIVLYKIFTGPVYNYMNVYKEPPIREMSSIPSVQLARVYNYNKSILNKDDLRNYKLFYNNLDKFKYYKIVPSISDTIKNVLNVEYTNNHLNEYVQFWLKVSLKDPKNYIEAFLLNNLGVWYPGKHYNDFRMYHPYIEYKMSNGKEANEDYENFERKSKLPIYDKILHLVVERNGWKIIPVVSAFFNLGTYFLIFIYSIGVCIIRKKRKYIVAISAITGLYITIFLAPVALFRYSFPIVILLPIFAGIVLDKQKEQ
ncbi:MAG: hypothetical protein ILA19_00600 [Bacilli bacterium]|nr:hypothetical protein [Bacilli bacterium]